MIPGFPLAIYHGMYFVALLLSTPLRNDNKNLTVSHGPKGLIDIGL